MAKNNKTIYDLELNESMSIQTEHNFLIVNRVPGGWIYSNTYAGESVSSVFVPMNKEFKKNQTTKINV